MIAAILQARMSSSRLPGKVLMPILGRPMICRQLERIRQARRIDRIIVATSADSTDDSLATVVEREGLECFRGALDDVLDRIYQAALASRADHIVRLTADCPLVDPVIVDSLIELHLSDDFDYSSNFIDRRFPDGLDSEILSSRALAKTWREATNATDREHVTPYIYRHPRIFRIGSLRCEHNFAAQRWTVDHPQDLEFVAKVFETLYPESRSFSMWNVLELLDRRPELREINCALSQYA